MSTPLVVGPELKTHDISDIGVWKYPDRNYYVFITLSVFFGFLGLDHFYLRSFGTGMQKLTMNIFALGLWYFWDLLQICFDSQKVRTEGLDSPFEWIRGIGRGVFTNPTANPQGGGNTIIRSRKDILIYAILTIMFGIFGLDKLYLGLPWQAATKFLSVFNFLFFLFGLLWVIWDIVNVLFYTESILKDGITPPLPYSLLFPKFDTKNQFIPEVISIEQHNLEAEIFRDAWSTKGIINSHFWIWNWDIWIWNWNIFRRTLGVHDVPEKRSSFDNSVPGVVTAFNISDLLKPPIMPQQQELQQSGGGLSGSSSNTGGPIIAGTLSAIVLAGMAKAIVDMVKR
jgi:TM2 domain-containing membrane protein YozV